VRLVIATLTLPAALAAQAPADTVARPVRLAEAIQLAQRNAPTAVQAQGQLRSSAAAVRSAYAAFTPSVTLSASATRAIGTPNRVDPLTNRLLSGRWSSAQGVALNLDLFDGGSRVFDLQSARAQVNAAESSELAQRYQITLQVKQQFYAVLAAREEESAARSQLALAHRQLRDAIAKVRARTATKSDSLRALIQVGNAQLALLTGRDDLQTANAALTRLVATPFTITASPEDTVGEESFAIDSAALATLAQQGPTVQQAQASLQAARASSKAARSPYLPTLSLSYGLSRSAADSTFGGVFNDFSRSGQLRFTLSYPVFNQLAREEGVVRADVATTNAEAALRDARLAAQQSLVQYLGALRTAQQQITIQVASVVAAEEDLRVQQQRYELGASTLLDVLTSQSQLIQARAALIQARFNYRVAKAQLEALVGRTL
jgi:outer membrane protein